MKHHHVVTPQDILRILRNNHYQGLLKHAGKLYGTRHFDVPREGGEGGGPVIEPERFAMAQARLAEGRSPNKTSRACLLSGIVVCSACGRPMIVRLRQSGTSELFCPYRSGRPGLRRCNGTSARSITLEVLEEWVLEHLAPLLCAELQALKASQKGEGVERRLAAAESELRTAIEQEGQKLAQLADVLDAVQLAEVATQLRSRRESLHRQVSELRTLARRERAENRDPFDLLSHSKSALREALKRSVRWIAVTRQGVVVLTAASGGYVGARLVNVSDGRKGYRGARIMPPTCQATLECRAWISDSEGFLEGAQIKRGRRGRVGSPEELLPDFKLADDLLDGPEGDVLRAAYVAEEETLRREMGAELPRPRPRPTPTRRDKTSRLEKEEMEAVEAADSLREEGLSYRDIALRLNAIGWRTPRGCTYMSTTVQRMIERSHRYASAPLRGECSEVAA